MLCLSLFIVDCGTICYDINCLDGLEWPCTEFDLKLNKYKNVLIFFVALSSPVGRKIDLVIFSRLLWNGQVKWWIWINYLLQKSLPQVFKRVKYMFLWGYSHLFHYTGYCNSVPFKSVIMWCHECICYSLCFIGYTECYRRMKVLQIRVLRYSDFHVYVWLPLLTTWDRVMVLKLESFLLNILVFRVGLRYSTCASEKI